MIHEVSCMTRSKVKEDGKLRKWLISKSHSSAGIYVIKKINGEL